MVFNYNLWFQLKKVKESKTIEPHYSIKYLAKCIMEGGVTVQLYVLKSNTRIPTVQNHVFYLSERAMWLD